MTQRTIRQAHGDCTPKPRLWPMRPSHTSMRLNLPHESAAPYLVLSVIIIVSPLQTQETLHFLRHAPWPYPANTDKCRQHQCHQQAGHKAKIIKAFLILHRRNVVLCKYIYFYSEKKTFLSEKTTLCNNTSYLEQQQILKRRHYARLSPG